ncbi:hypothetical protein ACUXIZ_005374 [Cytobacillus horneckiae]
MDNKMFLSRSGVQFNTLKMLKKQLSATVQPQAFFNNHFG